MKPSKPLRCGGDLFREPLDAIIDLRHPLVRLAGLLPWPDFEESLGHFYMPLGRSAKPTRIMVGLMDGLARKGQGNLPELVNTNWTVAGVADFGGDRKAPGEIPKFANILFEAQ